MSLPFQKVGQASLRPGVERNLVLWRLLRPICLSYSCPAWQSKDGCLFSDNFKALGFSIENLLLHWPKGSLSHRTWTWIKKSCKLLGNGRQRVLLGLGRAEDDDWAEAH